MFVKIKMKSKFGLAFRFRLAAEFNGKARARRALEIVVPGREERNLDTSTRNLNATVLRSAIVPAKGSCSRFSRHDRRTTDSPTWQ